MKKVLIFLLFALVFILLSLWLVDHPGTITVSWLDYEITTSVAVLLAFIAFIKLVANFSPFFLSEAISSFFK